MTAEKTNGEIEDAVRKELEGTEYVVSSLTPLSGGTTNFIYRATLQKSLPDGISEIVLKHGEPYVSRSPNFKLKMVRCVSFPIFSKIIEGCQLMHALSVFPFIGY